MVLHVEFDEDNEPFVQIGEHQVRVELQELNDEFKERARIELRETPEVVEKALEELKTYITDEPDFYVCLDDTKFLIKFLRPFKFYPESAFKTLKTFYEYKRKYSELLGPTLTITNIKLVLENEVLLSLPTRTPAGARIAIINIGKWNTSVISLRDIIRAVVVSIDIGLLEPKTQVAGFHIIFNFNGLSLSHVYQFTPSLAKLIIDLIQECAPLRLKGIHIVNQPFLFNMVYSFFKPFLNEKLKNRIIFHGSNRKTLCEALSAEALPEELGGLATLADNIGQLTSTVFCHYESHIQKFYTYGYRTPEK